MASCLVAPSQAGLIGRDHVLSRVRTHLVEARVGRGYLVLLSGEPGIGKTRLAVAITEVAGGLGFRMAWGSCRETEGAPPYWPWTQIFRALQASNQAQDAILAPLLHPAQTDISETDRFRLFDAATQALANAAADCPLLIVLDDLHRADEASLKLLRFIVPSVRNTADSGVMAQRVRRFRRTGSGRFGADGGAWVGALATVWSPGHLLQVV